MPDGASARRFSFGQFVLDVRSGELRRQGIRIKLQISRFTFCACYWNGLVIS
jgi:hypothetical protein